MEATKNTVKCRYSHCDRFHESKDVPIKEAVKSDKGTYYHSDCLKESETMRNVIDLFVTHINANVVFSELRKVVNNIVYEKGCNAEFLEFGLQYYIRNHKNLNYPRGLYYVIQDMDVQKAWKKKLEANEPKPNFTVDEVGGRQFEFKQDQKSDFEKILC